MFCFDISFFFFVLQAMLCDDIDDETLRLVLQIQLEDLESIKQSSKGKTRQGEFSDADIAVEAYKSELKTRILLASDRCMCKSIAKANQLDGRLVSILASQEKQAARDREAALRLSRGGKIEQDPHTDATQGKPSAEVDEELLSKLKSLYVSTDDYDDDDILDQAESSTWAASRGQTADATSAVKREKRMCNSCLSNYIVTDLLLSSKLIGEFQAKAVEFSTPNRTYCHKPTCSTFIPKEFIKDDIAFCQRCGYRTCVMCKGAEHKNQDCAQDTLTQSLLQVAAANGWQRCLSCRRIVELDHGCYHITCRCGTQFCYLCGRQWKTCACAQWSEERLLARANAIVDRDANALFMNPEGRARRVEREAHNLVMNHQCTHDTWKSRGGSHRWKNFVAFWVAQTFHA
ncbi:hypothetical protein Cob_v006699 [Colletotrichum orbiculare MAFF 240422]|uniref:RBR-type E3 ubiquitin transferase n=1 Tax=Colletotrichum orbiculare (strain 104-T / ATCC 96160 / CBS 514.97 / LARS 414 / MAFF 240422) TaxID=1213857 RepID=A0A484FS57_COLOR|nr:hypothetical protein Cob_v006699 [Colletotrichum orbiculare MAFF 240422]